jgi:hypothetical protein
MTALVNVEPGCWVRPDQVIAVMVFNGTSGSSPSAKVYFRSGPPIGCGFETLERATAWATLVAEAVASALSEQEA